jgi:4'-phosphopantetheinyl transferase
MPATLVTYNTLPAVKWEIPAELPVAELVIFRIELVRFSALIPRFSTLLSADEVTRAQRYFHEKDRHRFIVTRGLLRIILGLYTNQQSSEIQFIRSVHKKPSILGSDWNYNVSHSGDWAVIAIGKIAVGIDVEKIDLDFRFQEVIPESFDPDERFYIERSPESRTLFYRLWTRKEALVKATGQGIDDYFKHIPSRDGVHEVDSQLLANVNHLTVSSFEVTTGYAAAVAYASAATIPHFCELDPAII